MVRPTKYVPPGALKLRLQMKEFTTDTQPRRIEGSRQIVIWIAGGASPVKYETGDVLAVIHPKNSPTSPRVDQARTY
jgi:hypothetical protein